MDKELRGRCVAELDGNVVTRERGKRQTVMG